MIYNVSINYFGIRSSYLFFNYNNIAYYFVLKLY